MWFTFGLSSLGKAGVKATRAGVKDALKIAGSQSDEIAAGIMRVGEDRIFAAANKFLAEKEISVAAKSDIAPVLARFLKEASNDTATHSFKIKNFDDAFNAAMAYHGIYTKATDMDIIRLINKAKATQRARMTNTILRTIETSNDVKKTIGAVLVDGNQTTNVKYGSINFNSDASASPSLIKATKSVGDSGDIGAQDVSFTFSMEWGNF